ncbi:MAG: sigma-70 family RNA polymerase sigma factor [Planctomycetota bacterium]
MSTLRGSCMMEFMERSEILRILMPERTKQIALAWSILRQSQFSEDAYQDMLARVLENEAVFEGPRHLRDWSWKVLRNRCYEMIRQQKYQATLLDESILDLVDAELERRETGDIPSRIDALHTCLGALSEPSRETIKMRYFEGMRGKQIAERLGRKPETVYKSLQRIYATLSACIERKLGASKTEGFAS